MKPNQKDMPIDKIHEKIRKDLNSKNKNEQETAVKALLPAFNRFVKDGVKRGDYQEFKASWEAENEAPLTDEEYITNLADIFLEPFLPLDLKNPDKHKELISGFAKRFIKAYM